MKRDRRQILTEYLVLSAQGGAVDAFRQLHELWAADLRRMALVRIQRVDEVEVVTQEAWLAVAQGLNRLDDPACFPRWAFQIVNRKAVDWIRRQQSDRRRIEYVRDSQAPSTLSGPGPGAESDRSKLTDVISRLGADERELLHLFYEAGRSVAEISVIIGIPVGTVKSRLFKVRESIKQNIEGIIDEGLG